ncbi:hypothetical protein [Bradyrhizobium sp. AUGA SZCCT0182]|uniref:hypothetical protein n=1 Tax=Bradyrhizobium sp. AUGA SZCCT0182 TaxID=2807667 RepID=UPI001BAD4354|nr:hypothetical protein [Bradyrhizobium sp. AUGA SZCCT0182]MBR1232023.1 hypothetical protein [Bradyrhizobium sp. AUGA SZCCT0182]
MAYVVQADLPGDESATITVVTREEALKTALGWQKDGTPASTSSATAAFTRRKNSL